MREQLAFIDARSLPVVADRNGAVSVWHFSGGLASASLARALASYGLTFFRWDDFSVSVRATNAETVARAIAKINSAEAQPSLPEEMSTALKFSACLPTSIAAAILRARTAVPTAVAEILSRPIPQLRS